MAESVHGRRQQRPQVLSQDFGGLRQSDLDVAADGGVVNGRPNRYEHDARLPDAFDKLRGVICVVWSTRAREIKANGVWVSRKGLVDGRR
jgi:hypothetical protein